MTQQADGQLPLTVAPEIGRALAGVDLSPELTASWERSVKHGLRRQDHALFNNAVTRAIARRVADENHRLLTHATPEMVRLYGGLGSARWVSLCVNSAGQVVCAVGDATSAPRPIRALMYAGRSLGEAELGTTAPGCALEVGRSVVVARDEHYLLELSNFFCASAPICGPDGNLAGALDISGVDVESLPLAKDLTGLAARAIENSLLADLPDCTVLQFHCDERLVGTPFEAVLAVGPDGAVGGANRAARQLLGLQPTGPVQGMLDSMFDVRFTDLLIHARRHGQEPTQVRTRTGALTHLKIGLPRTAERRRAVAGNATRGARPPANAPQFTLRDEKLTRDFERALCMFRNGLPTLLEGETGTGKEVVARAMHAATRPSGPFVALNCAAMPEGLIEAELFGYADGAFTGGRKGGARGRIEQADGGVLFLDEIGDMAVGMQSRLLRVVQERVVTRIGESRELPVDVLILSATHCQLDVLVARGEFREDLYYRLSGFTLRLPPLRARTDLADIATEFLLRYDAEQGARQHKSALDAIIQPRAFALLLNYSWPGNIRQLEQTIRALVALRSPDVPIDINDLPDVIRMHGAARSTDKSPAQAGKPTLAAAQDALIRQVLGEHGGNVSAAARALGVSRTTLYSRLNRPSGRGAT